MTKQASLDIQTFSVSQLIDTIQSHLLPLNPIVVHGEIASHTRSGLGHQYFELKDDNAKIRCVIFKGSIRQAPPLKDGLAVKITARANIYAPQGSLQLKVDRLEALGDGLLQIRFEKLKKKLAAEGLFDESRKQPLPDYPEKIVLITSANAAAYHDVCKTLKLHWPFLHVLFIAVSVQGPGSIKEISRALRYTNREAIVNQYDLVMLVRGGGSLDDLWSFNEEEVVRAGAAVRLPLVTGIGHEIDSTLCDYVADVRGATPTAAATAIAPGQQWLGKHIRQQISQAKGVVDAHDRDSSGKYTLLTQRLINRSPRNEIDRLRQNIDLLQSRASRATTSIYWRKREVVRDLHGQIRHFHPNLILSRRQELVNKLTTLLREQIVKRLLAERDRMVAQTMQLAYSEPRRVFEQTQSRFRIQLLQLRQFHPKIGREKLERCLNTLADISRDCLRLIEHRIAQLAGRTQLLATQLGNENPKPNAEQTSAILRRGFALIEDESGNTLTRTAKAMATEHLKVRLNDGRFKARAIRGSETFDEDDRPD